HATILNFKLKQRVTRRKIDVIRLARIPTSDNQATRIRIGANLFQQVCDLVHAVPLRIIPAERTPEKTVNWSKITSRPAKLSGVFFVGPLGPDVYATRAQVRLTRVA